MDKKRCTKCGEEKPLSEFHRDRTRPDGRYSFCATCRCTIVRERRRAAGMAERKTYPQVHDRDWLAQKHLREWMTTQEIADLLGCTRDTVRCGFRQAEVAVIPPAVLATLRARRGEEAQA
jgi:hypothetical protein